MAVCKRARLESLLEDVSQRRLTIYFIEDKPPRMEMGTLIKKRAICLFQHFGILPIPDDDHRCDECGSPLTIQIAKDTTLGWRFYCPCCPRYLSPLGNTALFRNHTGYDIATYLAVSFLQRTVMKTASEELSLSQETLRLWYKFFRRVMRSIANHEYVKIGGPKDVVEVDESCLRRNKDGRKRVVSKTWVLGGISRTTRKVFGCSINRKTKDIIGRKMIKHIDRRSYICTDSLNVYRPICEKNFNGHGIVNHPYQFLNPPLRLPPHFVPASRFDPACHDKQYTGKVPRNKAPFRNHTQSVEQMWRMLKKTTGVGICRNPNLLDDYIGEWMYRTNILKYCKTKEEKFHRFFSDIARVYPGVGKKPMQVDPEICDCHECEPL